MMTILQKKGTEGFPTFFYEKQLIDLIKKSRFFIQKTKTTKVNKQCIFNNYKDPQGKVRFRNNQSCVSCMSSLSIDQLAKTNIATKLA